MVMTPKEKALELAIKFCSPSDVIRPNIASVRNALICIDEILKDELGIMPAKWMSDYWEEVKQEIKKL